MGVGVRDVAGRFAGFGSGFTGWEGGTDGWVWGLVGGGGGWGWLIGHRVGSGL